MALCCSIHHINHFKQTSSSSPNQAQAEINSNVGEYLMKYSLGTPPVQILGFVDTGDDLISLQCKPCDECYKPTIKELHVLTLKSQAHTKMFHALHPYVYKEAQAQTAIIQFANIL